MWCAFSANPFSPSKNLALDLSGFRNRSTCTLTGAVQRRPLLMGPRMEAQQVSSEHGRWLNRSSDTEQRGRTCDQSPELGKARLQKMGPAPPDPKEAAAGLQRRNRVTTNYALASIRTSWRYIGRPNIRNREQIRFDTTRQAVFDE